MDHEKQLTGLGNPIQNEDPQDYYNRYGGRREKSKRADWLKEERSEREPRCGYVDFPFQDIHDSHMYEEEDLHFQRESERCSACGCLRYTEAGHTWYVFNWDPKGEPHVSL